MLRRFCPHWFGWSYAKPGRQRRSCRLCAKQQVLTRDWRGTGVEWFDV